MDSLFFSPIMLLKSSTIIILLISSLFNISSSQAQNLQIENFQFGNPFNPKNSSEFAILEPSIINNGALQVTPDSANPNFLLNRAGRIFFNQSFKLWDDDHQDPTGSGKVVSFNTSFDINVFRFNNTLPGEGLAFLLAPDLTVPANSKGEYLGLTNATTDGDSSNGIVAIEFDTSKEDSISDPDDNHMGLNIHSVRSNITVSLSQFRIQIAPVDPKFYTVWIQYDGDKKTIKAYMAERGNPKPATPQLSSNLNLKGLVKQESYFGFSASTGTDVQLNCVLAWNLTVEMIPRAGDGDGDGDGGSKGNAVKIWLPVGVVIAAAVVAVIGGLWYYYVWRKRRTPDPNLLTALQSLPGTPKEFRYKDLRKATNNFEDKNKLGQGGFGVVYKGLLPNENKLVAVKKFSRGNMEGQDDFLSELTIINRLRHRHLVPLVGWCHKNGMLLLVYDYMPNGSLDGHLFHEGEGSTMLEWNLRYKIVSGVASALHYLHYEYDQRVVHRDLKASNILLDSDFNARLGDFGLARCLENEKTSYADQMEGVPGTVGYIAPECFHTARATRESDVFAFGAVVLEVVCGQRPWTKIEQFQFLVDWVWSLHREGRILDAVDEKLNGDYVAEEAERLLLLGLACSHPIAGERPKTRAIFQIISGSMTVPRVPPFKPAFVWPSSIGTLSSLDVDSITDITPMTSGWTPQCLSTDSYGAERYTDSSVV